MTDSSTGTIYALIDPRTEAVRYVGQTAKPIEVRLAGHLAAPAPLVKGWIEELAVEGRRPEITPIREHVPAGELDLAEREEIALHAASGDLLNVASNAVGNAKRRKASREEVKRREAEEKAMDLSWRQASWRLVADQVRAATGGPMSPSEIPARRIPEAVWETYQSYREAEDWLGRHPSGGYLLIPGVGLTAAEDSPEAQERQEIRQLRQRCADGLEDFMRTFSRSFSAVDDGERYGDGMFGRGDDAYKVAFADPSHMERYLSLIPWAARSLDPWVALADAAGIDSRDAAFAEWVSDDPDTRAAVKLFQDAVTPGYLGRRYDQWDTDIASFTLALGAAHIPGFVVPELLRSDLRESLVKVAKDRQATGEMCKLLQEIDPKALDTVYGKDRLAIADAELGLPAGLAAQVIAKVFGTDHRGPDSEIGKLLQRNAGAFHTPAVPGYADWSGVHIPAMRSAVACFCAAGLFDGADGDLLEATIERSKRTWMPGGRGLQALEEVERNLQAKRAA
ncbi:hypothetical protein ACFXGR_22840 [Streptomyces mirabilis]|uniref:hypothetical protein n=1 Tax=Streptomyces mirabilis TaxID=68239 RepID=UPI0036A45F7C